MHECYFLHFKVSYSIFSWLWPHQSAGDAMPQWRTDKPEEGVVSTKTKRPIDVLQSRLKETISQSTMWWKMTLTMNGRCRTRREGCFVVSKERLLECSRYFYILKFGGLPLNGKWMFKSFQECAIYEVCSKSSRSLNRKNGSWRSFLQKWATLCGILLKSLRGSQ